MSEDTTSSQKRVLFKDDLDVSSGVVYPKSPILRSPRITKTSSHCCPPSSGQGSSKFRHKSPTSRHLSPHRSISKNKNISDWEDVNNSVRKTQSTALPAIIQTPWSRSTTVSTPDLKVENQNVGTDNDFRIRRIFDRLYPYRAKIHFYSQLIFIILNCIILAVGFVHVGAALILTISEDTVLIVVKYWYYVAYVITLYIDAIILICVSLTGFWFAHRKSWKEQYFACSLHIVGITIILGTYQYRIHSNIQENVRNNMMASMSTVRGMPTNTRVAWDYVQKTLKCCGVDGQVDWCTRSRHKRSFGKLLGLYTCSLPVSCCNKDIDEILSSEKFGQYSEIDDYVRCSALPTPSKVYNVGCFGHVTREIQYITNLLKVVNFVPALLLSFSTLTAMILSCFVLIDI